MSDMTHPCYISDVYIHTQIASKGGAVGSVQSEEGFGMSVSSGIQRAQIMAKLANRPSKVVLICAYGCEGEGGCGCECLCIYIIVCMCVCARAHTRAHTRTHTHTHAHTHSRCIRGRDCVLRQCGVALNNQRYIKSQSFTGSI